MDRRESVSEICGKRLGVAYVLNLSYQYNVAAKTANVLLICAEEEQRPE